VNREAQGFLLLLLGGAVLRASLTDVYLRYVRAGLRPLLLVAAVILIVAAAATFWYERRRSRAGHRDHGHREPWVAWLLVLPLFALILVVPPPLGAYTADRTGTALQPGLAVDAVPAGDPAPMSLAGYAEVAAFDQGRPLAGRRVRVTGFITVDRGGTPYLTRMVISCCAADGVPVKVGLAGQVPAGLRPDVWLDVIATYNPTRTRDAVNGGPIPYLTVVRATQVAAPADPYDS
jgi:uncharacterized repeat protein (TIGR03943 family)